MSVRMIGHDMHYGQIGFGNMVQSGANTFSAAELAAICEPDLIIKTGTGKRRVLDIDIDDVLVWDNRRWHLDALITPDSVGSENNTQAAEIGITTDNTSDSSNGPASAVIAQGTRPGGTGTETTGGAPGTTRMAGDDVPDYVMSWDFGLFANEENAAGDINIGGLVRRPRENVGYTPYEVDGITCHYLMTAAHYWLWFATEGLAAAAACGIGASVRRMSIDLEELMFDREVLLSILDALVLSN